MRSYFLFLFLIVVFTLVFTIGLTSRYLNKNEKTTKSPSKTTQTIQNPETPKIEKNETNSLKSKVKKVKKVKKNKEFQIKPELWMTFLVPTLSRNENYLTRTYQSLSEELPIEGDPLYGLIKVLVFNHNKNDKIHQEFDQLQMRIPFEKVKGNPTLASKKVEEQQTVDIIWMLNYILKSVKTRYIILLEDDFIMCKNSFLALQYFIKKATKWNQNWISLRVSYGMNGIIMKYEDLKSFISYLEMNLRNGKPPDHLFYDFSMNTKRGIMTYRSNLYYHIGKVSNFPGRAERYSPECYQVSYDWLQDFERFRNEDCPTEDISPCKFQQSQEPLVDFDLEAKDLCRKHFPLCWDPKIKTLEDSKNNHCRLRY